MGFLDDLEKNAEGAVSSVEGALDDVGQYIGRGVEGNAQGVAAGLRTLGLDGAADTVDSFGDTVASDLGVTIAEKQLGQTRDPAQLVLGDVAKLTDTVRKLQAFARAFGETSEGLTGVDSEHWVGQAADAFRAKFDPHVKQWADARQACDEAASTLDSYAELVRWAQDQARQAIDRYDQGQQATQQAQTAHNQQVAAYNQAAQNYNQAISAGKNPGLPPTRPAAFVDPGTDLRQQAQELLDNARSRRDAASAEAEAALRAATDLAPAEPSFAARMFDYGQDAQQFLGTGVVHLVGGAIKDLASMQDFMRSLNPLDGYNIRHFADYLGGLSTTAAGLVEAPNHPLRLVKGILGDEWGSDPFEAVGQLIPQIALAVLTDGGSAAADAGLDGAKAAEGAVRGAEGLGRDAGGLGREVAGGPVENARPPGDMTTKMDPIEVVSGNMLLSETDVELPGALPLVVERTHISAYRSGRWFGRSWASTLDQRLIVDDQQVRYTAPDGVVLFYPTPAVGASVLPEEGVRRWPLTRARDGGFTVTDPLAGRTSRFAVEIGGLWPITAITDRAGHRIAFHYRPDGTPVEITHDGGYRIRVTVADGQVTALHLGGEADVELMRYGYADGNLTEVINSSGRPERFEYDQAGRITGWVDRNDSWYRYTFDGDGRCVRCEGVDGILSGTFEYDPGHRTTVLTDAVGAVHRYAYDERLHIIAETNPAGHTTRTQVDRYGRVLARTDPLGRVTRFEYAEVGNVLRVTRPDGSQAVAEYNAANLPVTLVEPDGAVWRYGYDEYGDRVEVTDPAGAVTRYRHGERGHLTGIVDPLGAVTRVETDAAGLPIVVTDPTGAVTRWVRDEFGRITEQIDPVGGVTRFGWSVDGKPAWRTGPAGTTERWSYDGEGNQTSYTDQLGQITRTEYGTFDMPSATITPDGAGLEYIYDAELRLTAVTNPLGLVWRYNYDPAGNLISETDFNGRLLRYGRDPAGQLIQRVNGVGQTMSYVHDALGNIVEQTSTDERTRFTYDPVGRLVRATDGDTILTLTRDVCGRVITETCNGKTVTSGYDQAGRRIRRLTPSGVESTWEFDLAGRATVVHNGDHTLTFTHDAAGRETQRRLDEAFQLAQTWNPSHELASQTLVGGERHALTASTAARMLRHRDYTYRPDGYLTGITDTLSGARHFDLDPTGRVTAVRSPGGTETYSYDPAGNLTQAVWPVPARRVADAPERDPLGGRDYSGTLITRAGSIRYHHDRQGRVVMRQHERLSSKDWVWRFTWDANDQLTDVLAPDGSRWQYRYDPLGRRIAKQRLLPDNTVVEQIDFVWDGDRLVEQTHNNARVTTWEYLPGSFTPVSQAEKTAAMGPVDPDQAWFDQRFYAIVTDLVGTPTELVDTGGNLAWQQHTTLWGALLNNANNRAFTPLRFPGQYHDPETGLYYNFHRYYDPRTARYTTPDPLGQAPNPANPHTYTPNPLSWLDPLGLACKGKGGSKDSPVGNIVDERGVKVKINSNDHPPAHAHVEGSGPKTRIGQNGKPLRGDPELSRQQQDVIDDNKDAIRDAIGNYMRWFRESK